MYASKRKGSQVAPSPGLNLRTGGSWVQVPRLLTSAHEDEEFSLRHHCTSFPLGLGAEFTSRRLRSFAVRHRGWCRGKGGLSERGEIGEGLSPLPSEAIDSGQPLCAIVQLLQDERHRRR